MQIEMQFKTPRSYTAAGNRKSPGYVQAIMWISEIWHDLDPALISRSFDHCGITSSNLADYGSQLRHFARTNELVDDIEPVDPAITDDGPAFDVHHGDEWEEEGTLTDSDNDEDEEEREE